MIHEMNEDEKKLNYILDNLSFLDKDNEDDAIDIQRFEMELHELIRKADFKAEWFITAMREAESIALAKKEVAERAVKMHRSANNAFEYAKQRAFQYCDEMGIHKVKGDFGSYGRQRGRQGVAVPEGFDARKLPEEFVKTTPELYEVKKVPLLRKLKELEELNANEEGVDFFGVGLVRGDDIMYFANN